LSHVFSRRAPLISRARLALIALVGTGAVVAAACGLATNGTGENVGDHPETGSPIDATVGDEVTVDTDGGVIVMDSSTDGSSTNDASEDADANLPTFLCDDAGITSCSACVGRPTACGSTGACVAECTTDCPGARVPCYRCSNGGLVVDGTCEAEDDAGYCLNGAYSPGAACPCPMNKDASGCPGDFQVCMDAGLGYSCHSCGEPGTKDQVCKGGTGAMKCDMAPDAAQNYTCH